MVVGQSFIVWLAGRQDSLSIAQYPAVGIRIGGNDSPEGHIWRVQRFIRQMASSDWMAF